MSFFNKTKYYFVSYHFQGNGQLGFGNMYFARDVFNPKEIRRDIEKEHPEIGQVVVLNWIRITKKEFYNLEKEPAGE